MTDPIGHYASPVTAQATKPTTNGAAGVVQFDADFVSFTSSSANNFVCLPSVSEIGRIVVGWVGANGFKLQTIAGTSATINNVDTSGAAVAVIPASGKITITYVAANTWLLERTSNLGAVTTAIVPA